MLLLNYYVMFNCLPVADAISRRRSYSLLNFSHTDSMLCKICSSVAPTMLWSFFFFFIRELQSGELPYWRLDVKRPDLLPSSKPRAPRRSRTEGHHLLSSAR